METRDLEFCKSMNFLPFQIQLLPPFFNVSDVIFLLIIITQFFVTWTFKIVLFCKIDILWRKK